MDAMAPVSVVIPALNEEATVRGVVEEIRQVPRVDEVIVVNNGSTDRTAQCAAEGGARVIDCPEPGFGRALITGFEAARNPWVLKIDADIRNPDRAWVDKLVEAAGPSCSLVKGFWRNDEDPLPVTDMLLRPGFAKLFPCLNSIVLPSGGIYLVDKTYLPLDQMHPGFAFDIDVVIRIHRKGRSIGQACLGEVYDRLKPISAYREMAQELFAFMVDAASAPATTSLFIFMAHPDDTEIWAGGTLVKHLAMGSELTVAIATSDEIREREALKLAEQLPRVNLHLLKQTSFEPFNSSQTISSVAKLVEKHKPTIILTHHHDDIHADHRRCFEIIASALLLCPRRLMPKRFLMCNSYFQTSNLRNSFRPDTYIDISGEAEQKHRLILNHASQEPEFWIEMSKRIDALNGMKCGVRYAEAFESCSFFTLPSPQSHL